MLAMWAAGAVWWPGSAWRSLSRLLGQLRSTWGGAVRSACGFEACGRACGGLDWAGLGGAAGDRHGAGGRLLWRRDARNAPLLRLSLAHWTAQRMLTHTSHPHPHPPQAQAAQHRAPGRWPRRGQRCGDSVPAGWRQVRRPLTWVSIVARLAAAARCQGTLAGANAGSRGAAGSSQGRGSRRSSSIRWGASPTATAGRRIADGAPEAQSPGAGQLGQAARAGAAGRLRWALHIAVSACYRRKVLGVDVELLGAGRRAIVRRSSPAVSSILVLGSEGVMYHTAPCAPSLQCTATTRAE
jgi:hypothetical protein